MTRGISRLGLAVRLVVVVVVAAAVSFHSVPRARAQDVAPTPFEIDGTGAFEDSALMSAWGTPMFGSPSPVNLSYIGSGDRDGRTQLALGQVDFAVSGMPLSDQDQQRLAARNVSVIQAPLAVAAGAFLFAPPNPALLAYDTLNDPTDPESDITKHVYTGPVRMTNSVLANLLSTSGNYRPTNDPAFWASLDIPAGGTPEIAGETWAIARSDPGAANYYLEQYLLQEAPDSYNQHLTSQLLPAGTVSEDWPLIDMPERSGPKSVGDLIAFWQDPGGSGAAAGGMIGMVDPSTANSQLAVQDLKRTDPANHPGTPTPLTVVQVQNGAGEWVMPTPQSITIAAQAGGGQPLYGLTQPVSGAYPFTWTTSMFVPSTGLSVDKTNAIATFLRYATGPGQDLAASTGTGVLPDALRADAASKADQIVKSNCSAAGGTTHTDPTGGPFWPTGVTPPAGGTLLCTAAAGATTTTAAVSTSGTGSSGFGATAFNSPIVGSSSPAAISSSPLVSGNAEPAATGSEAPAASGDTASAPAAAPATTAAPETPGRITAVPAAANLPLPTPDDGEFALDRFTTILMGGLAFLLVRSFVRPRLVGST